MPTIPSVPATFSVAVPGSEAVTFAIPAGVWTSGTWDSQGVAGAGGGGAGVTCNAHSQARGTYDFGGGAYVFSAAVTALQLADINAAAGGTLNATYDSTNSFQDDVSLFTLTLVGGGEGGGGDPGGGGVLRITRPLVYIPGIGIQDLP
jgi:hypothetical protein